MKHRILSGALTLGLATLCPLSAQEGAGQATTPPAPTAPPAPAEPTDPAVIKTDSSYGFGFQSGRRFASETSRYGVTKDDIDKQAFINGFFAAFAGEEPKLDEAKIQAAMRALGTVLQNREQELAAKNLAAGQAYLAENTKRQGVTTTPSGLQYEVITPGGDQRYQAPTDGQPDNTRFLVNYRGTLIDGTEFDSSPTGKPVPMTLQVVPGFKEALTTMPVGAKWKLHIPANLAYGEQRRSAEIGPNTALVFELELVDIQKTEPAKAVTPPIQIPPPAPK
jgi:FKBP-type peptidyl-prolyl cis-trans isomerase